MIAIEPMSLTSGFEGVYRREYPGLVAVATALTDDVRDGEDAVQDTMVRLRRHQALTGHSASQPTVAVPPRTELTERCPAGIPNRRAS